MSSKKVGIIQSNYIPWKGYFDFIDSMDLFILFDDVQYTRRDWRNRNKIKTSNGTRWLSIAVEAKGNYHEPISSIRVAQKDWAKSHLESIKQAYKDAEAYDCAYPLLLELYAEAANLTHLSGINRLFIERICSFVGIETEIRDSAEYNPEFTKSDRLISICKAAGATTYVSGPAAKVYLQEDKFAEAGIAVEWFEYGPYLTYNQPHEPFEHHVSIVDLLFCCGKESIKFIRS